ncbi:MAG: EEP domain-containing protein, partial [Mesorhizobium sp.]
MQLATYNIQYGIGLDGKYDVGRIADAVRGADVIALQEVTRTRTFQLGNMVLSKTPIHLSRNLLLPRSRSLERMNFQRGALEALIETPLGFIRFYSTHLDHRSPVERQSQIRFLRQRLLNYALEGGGLSGIPEIGLPDLPYPEAFIVMGDFNMLPGSPEYVELAGRP